MIVNQGIETYFPEKHVRVIAEPGRFYVASAFTLVTSVHSKKIVYNPLTNDLDRVMYYVNDGVYGSFNCLLYDHQVVKPKLLHDHHESERKVKSVIFGPTCDALDQIIGDIQLPESIQIGDFIYFENMGAYTLPVASPFNGFPLPKVYSFIQRDMLQMISSSIPLDADDYIDDFIGKTIELSTTASQWCLAHYFAIFSSFIIWHVTMVLMTYRKFKFEGDSLRKLAHLNDTKTYFIASKFW